MSATADILADLERITHATTCMLQRLDQPDVPPTSDRRETKRRVLAIRAEAHELLEWLSEIRLDGPRN